MPMQMRIQECKKTPKRRKSLKNDVHVTSKSNKQVKLIHDTGFYGANLSEDERTGRWGRLRITADLENGRGLVRRLVLLKVKTNVYCTTSEQTIATLRIRHVYPGSQILILPIPGISDSGSNNSNKERGGKIGCPTFFLSNKFHKILNILLLNRFRKKIYSICKELEYFSFYPKIVTKLLKIWVGDPGPEIRKKPIPDLVLKKARSPQHWTQVQILKAKSVRKKRERLETKEIKNRKNRNTGG